MQMSQENMLAYCLKFPGLLLHFDAAWLDCNAITMRIVIAMYGMTLAHLFYTHTRTANSWGTALYTKNSWALLLGPSPLFTRYGHVPLHLLFSRVVLVACECWHVLFLKLACGMKLGFLNVTLLSKAGCCPGLFSSLLILCSLPSRHQYQLLVLFCWPCYGAAVHPCLAPPSFYQQQH